VRSISERRRRQREREELANFSTLIYANCCCTNCTTLPQLQQQQHWRPPIELIIVCEFGAVGDARLLVAYGRTIQRAILLGAFLSLVRLGRRCLSLCRSDEIRVLV